MIKVYISLLLLFLLAVACQQDTEIIDENISPVSSELLREGWVRMKFKDIPGDMEQALTKGDSGDCLEELGRIFQGVRVTAVKRVFPFAGQYEERSRKEGLHLWYDVCLEKTSGMKNVINSKSSFSVDIIEPEYEIKLLGHGPVVPYTGIATVSAGLPFDDPYLGQQWHYHNEGSLANSAAGADIGIVDVWKQRCNSSHVVVAIIDEGVDMAHIDLQGNFWTNTVEQQGVSGTDDDNNGYIDDLMGWNFVTNSPVIVPTDHGTHVAGLVGAENNNGIGVCGVAGGYGGHTGCKLLNCQIVDANGKTAANVPAAIKYAADRGAHICQNSWIIENGKFPESLQAAIDYFVKYAGTDKQGKQIGPIQGGLVVFAAGNQNIQEKVYPSCYEKVLAVAGFAPDFTKAYYSNYGTWVDMAAPGGSSAYHGKYDDYHMILSTIANNKIGYLEGTSMAAPQVSGIAALLIAKYGGIGFTAEHLKARLLAATKNIDQYNPGYTGKLGVGYIDAALAFQAGMFDLDPVENMVCTALPGAVAVKWNGSPSADSYRIFWGRESFSDLENLPAECRMAELTVTGENGGDVLEYTIGSLLPATEYCIGIAVYDRFGNHSQLVTRQVRVIPNMPPVIVRQGEGEVILPYRGKVQVNFGVSDPEKGELTYRLEDETECAAIVRTEETLIVEIKYKPGVNGRHTVCLLAEDEYGAVAAEEFVFMVSENSAPVLIKQLGNLWYDERNITQEINLTTVFGDPDKELLTYGLEYDREVVYMRTENNCLYISPVGLGSTTVKLTASDVMGLTCETTFLIMVKDKSRPVELYPNPVLDHMNIRMGKEVEGDILVSIYAGNGSLVLKKQISVAPFKPGVLEVEELSGGHYTVLIGYQGKEYKTSFIKL